MVRGRRGQDTAQTLFVWPPVLSYPSAATENTRTCSQHLKGKPAAGSLLSLEQAAKHLWQTHWWVSPALRHVCKCKRVCSCFNSVWFGSSGKLFNEELHDCYCRVAFSRGWRHAGGKAWSHLQREMCHFPRGESQPAECHPCPDWLLHLLQLPWGRAQNQSQHL